MRAVAAYQLATLLLQDSTTAKEGDELVWRLGFRLRLADEALRYDATLRRPPRRAQNAPRVVDRALSDANLRSLAAIFGRDAAYWPAHAGSDGFYSYNVPLDDEGPLGGFLRALRPAANVDGRDVGRDLGPFPRGRRRAPAALRPRRGRTTFYRRDAVAHRVVGLLPRDHRQRRSADARHGAAPRRS